MGRHALTTPNPKQARIIELALESRKIKNFNYRQIAEQIAEEFNCKVCSRENIRQVLVRWDAGYDKTRPTPLVAEKARAYAKGATTTGRTEMHKAAKRMGYKLRGNARQAAHARRRALQKAELWNDTSLTVEDLARLFKMKNTRSVYAGIGRLKAVYKGEIEFINRKTA